MSASVLTLFTETTLDGFPLWVVLLICGGVFLAGFMDAIAGGGGIISVPVYLMAFSGLPTHFVLGTNKLSSCIGTAFSTARFIHQGYVHWRLFLPAAGLAVAGSVCGTQLQLHTPDVVLKYLLLAVLPVVAFFTLRTKTWPEEPAPIPPRRQAAIVWAAALLIGTYDGYYGPGTGHLSDAGVHPLGQDGHPPRGRRSEGHQPGLQHRRCVLRPDGGDRRSGCGGWRPLWPPSWDTIWAPAWPSGMAAKSSGLRWWSCCSCCW